MMDGISHCYSIIVSRKNNSFAMTIIEEAMRRKTKESHKNGINKFKCATISETEMVAGCGAPDILLALQPVGPNIARFFKLKQNTFCKVE